MTRLESVNIEREMTCFPKDILHAIGSSPRIAVTDDVWGAIFSWRGGRNPIEEVIRETFSS